MIPLEARKHYFYYKKYLYKQLFNFNMALNIEYFVNNRANAQTKYSNAGDSCGDLSII